MSLTPEILPDLIKTISDVIEQNAEEVTQLDIICGDGDHVTNLQRGIDALADPAVDLSVLDWAQSLQKIGMTLLSTMGGASGSLFGTLFIGMSKAAKTENVINQQVFCQAFNEGVEAVKKRGKSDAGEKTMLDVLIPVAQYMKKNCDNAVAWDEFLLAIDQTAVAGMESTRNMLATKGRASYLGDKTIGHIDAGARTSQLIISTIVKELK